MFSCQVRAPGDLGPLVELVIGHDNSGQGPGWHLEQVDITDIKTGQTWYFDCNQVGVDKGFSMCLGRVAV